MSNKSHPKRIKKTNEDAENALQFLEDLRILSSGVDEPTQMISLRIPANILRAIKLHAKFEGKKYQSLIVEYIRQGLFK